MRERFVDTFHCRSHAHCRTCRDLDGGRLWRRAVAEQFAVLGSATDFDCPDGLPWNVKESDVPGETRPGEKKPCGFGKASAPRRHVSPTRPSCLECVEKHLGAAWVLITEHRNGYPHRLLAIGHLHEAEEESQAWPELHAAIREARKEYQSVGQMPNVLHLGMLIRQIQNKLVFAKEK